MKGKVGSRREKKNFQLFGFPIRVWGYGYFAGTSSFKDNILKESHKIICGNGFINDDR